MAASHYQTALIIGWIVFCCLQLYCTPVLANPPKHVYRSDFRSPDDIFTNGFKKLGDNDDLNDHVTGASCYTGNQNTAFVATSESEQFATNWGRDRTVVNPDESYVYVYRIRATGNFYDVYQSLLQAYRITGDSLYQALASHYEYQQEWVAFNSITANQIERVDVYGRPGPDGNMPLIRRQTNPNYVDSQSHGNPDPYPISGPAPTTNWLLPSTLAYLTACFSFCKPGSSSLQDIATYASTCSVISPYTQSVAKPNMAFIWNIFTKQPVSVTVPWKAHVHTFFVKTHHYYSPTCCRVAPGTLSDLDLLEVQCQQCSKYFQKFVVRLEASGPTNLWVNQTFTDGDVNKDFNKWGNEIDVVGTSYTIKDYGYSVSDVFATGGGWSSTYVNVYPIYP